MDLPVLAFYANQAGGEQRAHYRTLGPHTTLMKSVSDCLVGDIHITGLLEVIWYDSNSTHPAPHNPVLLMG